MMLESLIEGFLLGVGAAVPLGPINILLMNRALRNYPQAVITGLGAMSADALYLSLILFGMIQMLQGGILSYLLSLGSIAFLFFLAYRIYQDRNRHLSSEFKEDRQAKRSVFLQGLFLTLVNPYTLAFWLSIGSYTTSKELDPMMTLIGMFSAIVLWVTLIPYFVHRSKHRISMRVRYILNVFSSMLLLGFGISLIVEMIDWRLL
ncbi:LysE family translocator [Sulfurovum sp. zt1-1]|uniref:LysE family translocator n=1 Tax=Sulfurovum zhangzhouensis TaxID=3019067 RepID=A0ABT7QVM0_9BACT|nr:LysE family translocator [Sulfurovum zhangzhouensis]MDM5270888.1 LysE family translocator [Sulfurovum zhangzhouensis]